MMNWMALRENIKNMLMKTIKIHDERLDLLKWGAKLIVKDSKICGGVPIIKGTRIPITLVLANICDDICFDDICQD